MNNSGRNVGSSRNGSSNGKASGQGMSASKKKYAVKLVAIISAIVILFGSVGGYFIWRSKNRKIDGTDTNWRTLAYYANVDYNYMGKYYLTGQLSMETSSRFGKKADGGLKMFGVAWGLFPSLQAAWVMSNEDWFHTNNMVNMLKLNAGFESVGNDAMDNSATLTYMASEMLFGNANSSLGLSNIGRF